MGQEEKSIKKLIKEVYTLVSLQNSSRPTVRIPNKICEPTEVKVLLPDHSSSEMTDSTMKKVS